jgi:hypothetical protein
MDVALALNEEFGTSFFDWPREVRQFLAVTRTSAPVLAARLGRARPQALQPPA